MLDYPDATVRAACVQALGTHGTVEDAELIVARLGDTASFVRWEAARALRKIHNPIAVGPLIQTLLNDQDIDTRIAAATALGQFPQSRVFQALVGALDDRSYGVVQAAQRSLHQLTGHDLGDDGRAWLNWARQRDGTLFDAQVAYRWHPYVKPRGFVDVIQFWRKPQEVPPRRPKEPETVDSPGSNHKS